MTGDSGLRLLLFNLKTDADAPLLGFTTTWINELARHCESIDVLTMYAGRLAVADNVRVYSAGREKGYGKPRRVLNFYAILTRLLLTRRYDACFAHMMPLFAGLAGPLLTLRGVSTTLWYTHRQRTRQLELGLWMSRRAVTAVETSFPIQSPKVIPIGHGIDTDYYAPDSQSGDLERPVIVQVARLMPIKHQATLLRAAAELDCDVVLVGDVPEDKSQDYKQQLVTLAAELNMIHRVTFTGDLPRETVREWYQRATLAVNLSPVGLFDKAPLESMACGVPTIVSNPAFDDLFGDAVELLRIDSPDDANGLTQRLQSLLMMSPDERHTLGNRLREAVIARHSLRQLVQRLVPILKTGQLGVW